LNHSVSDYLLSLFSVAVQYFPLIQNLVKENLLLGSEISSYFANSYTDHMFQPDLSGKLDVSDYFESS
jgi:hypothetical protein